jgi:hypothetical protein
MNGERVTQIATAIRFKEYILMRDVASRRVLLGVLREWLLERGGMPGIVAWVENLQTINDQIDDKTRKEQIKGDAFWDDLLLVHSADAEFLNMMGSFLGQK